MPRKDEQPPMRLARSGPPGSEIPVVAGQHGRWHDLRPVTADVDPGFLAGHGLSWARGALDEGELPEAEPPARFGPPLAPTGKIVCVGLNYSDHAAETGATPPAESILFMKAPDTVVGPADDVLIKGKGCATFNPLGPWLVTPDEVPDPQQLGLRLSVNGTVRQDSSTSKMIFDVRYLVWYISQFMTLYPGDVINTGTPAGVALGDPGQRPYLRAGDVVELEIDGLGQQRQTMRDA